MSEGRPETPGWISVHMLRGCRHWDLRGKTLPSSWPPPERFALAAQLLSNKGGIQIQAHLSAELSAFAVRTVR